MFPKKAGSNPTWSDVVKVENVVPKIDFFRSRFGVLRSQGFQKYKYRFCCQNFVWPYTGGHCVHVFVFFYFIKTKTCVLRRGDEREELAYGLAKTTISFGFPMQMKVFA